MKNETCIKCNKEIKTLKEFILDYEYWPTHKKCLGPYDLIVDGELKSGLEDFKRTLEIIAQDYSEAKHITIVKKRSIK